MTACVRPRTLAHLIKETYLSFKRDLLIFQKRPTNLDSLSLCLSVSLSQKRPTNLDSLSLCLSLSLSLSQKRPTNLDSLSLSLCLSLSLSQETHEPQLSVSVSLSLCLSLKRDPRTSTLCHGRPSHHRPRLHYPWSPPRQTAHELKTAVDGLLQVCAKPADTHARTVRRDLVQSKE